MYCEYWNLHKAPFDNVPDPSMYADCHASMEHVISETIFAIKEANEAFAVIIGAVGAGKTLSLRMISDTLEPEKYKVVIITNPGISFVELLKEIIGQITGQLCEESRKTVLLETFNRLLFTSNDHGQKIVILIDEASALSPANLENLRLLTNTHDDQRNLFTLVLAGQMDLAQRLEHPKRANLFQRIGTYCRIDKLPSEEAVKTYIATRLHLAGTNHKIFSDDCIPIIWEYSEHGVPRLINKICKLCLKTAETYGFDYISPNTVREVSERFQKLSETAVQKRKPRSRPEDPEVSGIITEENEQGDTLPAEVFPDHDALSDKVEAIIPADPETKPEKTIPIPEMIVPEAAGDESSSEVSAVVQTELQDQSAIDAVPDEKLISHIFAPNLAATRSPEEEGISFTPEDPHRETTADESLQDMPLPITPAATQPEFPDQGLTEAIPDEKSSGEMFNQNIQTIPVQPMENPLTPVIPVPEVTTDKSPQDVFLPSTLAANQPGPEEMPRTEAVLDSEITGETGPSSTREFSETNSEQDHSEEDKHQKTENEEYDEVVIGEHKIQLAIPKDILMQVKSFNRESAHKSAGFWAAQIIKNNPQLTRSPLTDPVYLWNEIKDSILKKIAL